MITHREQTMTSESDSVTPSQKLSATDKQIIDSVPKTMQNRAKLLIQKLKDHSDVIKWNDNGQLVSEGSIVPNSNIVDNHLDNRTFRPLTFKPAKYKL